MRPSDIASEALSRLAVYGFTPVLGAEIECYVKLKEKTIEYINPFFAPVIARAQEAKIPLLRIEEERGYMQFEIVLGMFSAPADCVNALNSLKEMLIAQGEAHSVPVSFAGKPYDDAPGSGLHLHLHLVHQHENAFHKTDDYISDALHYALGGLCALTPHVMPLLCPYPLCFARYRDKDHVATTASWGSNNRSCAVRIPYTPAWEDKRIEWRVPASNADPDIAVALLLHAVACGIDERIVPPVQSYGIASKENDAVALPLTMEQALARMDALPQQFAPLTPEILRGWLL